MALLEYMLKFMEFCSEDQFALNRILIDTAGLKWNTDMNALTEFSNDIIRGVAEPRKGNKMTIALLPYAIIKRGNCITKKSDTLTKDIRPVVIHCRWIDGETTGQEVTPDMKMRALQKMGAWHSQHDMQLLQKPAN